MDIPVLITYSNYGYIDFAKNLILSLAKVLKHHKLHFYCLDKQTYEELSKQSHDFLILELCECDVSSEFQNYETKEYKKIVHTKMSILRQAFQRYSFIHFIDCDVVCMKEPDESHYAKYSQFDVIFQYDWKFVGNAPIVHYGLWQCTGNMSMRKTEGTMYLISQIEEYQIRYPERNDQECLAEIFLDAKIRDVRYYRKTRFSVYPVEEYTNGAWEGDRSKIYFFHANHVIGKQAKIDLLKRFNQWFIQ